MLETLFGMLPMQSHEVVDSRSHEVYLSILWWPWHLEYSTYSVVMAHETSTCNFKLVY